MKPGSRELVHPHQSTSRCRGRVNGFLEARQTLPGTPGKGFPHRAEAKQSLSLQSMKANSFSKAKEICTLLTLRVHILKSREAKISSGTLPLVGTGYLVSGSSRGSGSFRREFTACKSEPPARTGLLMPVSASNWLRYLPRIQAAQRLSYVTLSRLLRFRIGGGSAVPEQSGLVQTSEVAVFGDSACGVQPVGERMAVKRVDTVSCKRACAIVLSRDGKGLYPRHLPHPGAGRTCLRSDELPGRTHLPLLHRLVSPSGVERVVAGV